MVESTTARRSKSPIRPVTLPCDCTATIEGQVEAQRPLAQIRSSPSSTTILMLSIHTDLPNRTRLRHFGGCVVYHELEYSVKDSAGTGRGAWDAVISMNWK